MTVWKCLLLTSQHDNYLPWLVLLPINCSYLVNCWINFYWLLRTQLNPRKITNLIWQINFFHQTCQRRGRIFNNKTHNLSSYYHTNIIWFLHFCTISTTTKVWKAKVIGLIPIFISKSISNSQIKDYHCYEHKHEHGPMSFRKSNDEVNYMDVMWPVIDPDYTSTLD